MKTLPEILKTQMTVDKYGNNSANKLPVWAVEAATEAIAKELMGIIGEDEPNPFGSPYIQTENDLRQKQRARLTAFIGHKEN